ncbi:hypothetical protein EZJ49_02205 [Bdellovibrio bacteriovorus]|uniref:hypothetical protein n=1 Tax=Bdellovibrio bacteriovorus TaxID=959 RepID=UPI0021D2DFEC|nr:hypothetical protein [Bdellovibrio bacteriovorus]UXR65061.1 hypothetical protein EZJ49_02205 [Bdellovibrio bacteriovorus]
MRYLIVFAFLFVAPSAFAQYVVRNGGYVVSCRNQAPLALEVAEAQAQNLTMDYSPARSFQVKVADLISRIRAVNPEKALKYTRWLQQWPEQVRWHGRFELTGPNDQGTIKLRAGCRMRIAIVQTNESRFGVQEYAIDSLLWQALNEDQKAALVMHEFIYRDVLEENPDSNSSWVRHVNTLVHSLDFQYRDRRAFTALIDSL